MGIGWESALRRLVEGRRVVLAGGVPANWAVIAGVLQRCGVADLMVVATEGQGAGTGPDVETVVVSPEHDGSLMGRIRAGDEVLTAPPPEVLDALHRFDPGRQALVLQTFLGTVSALDGRPTLAHRRPEWVRLEDKTLADALWDRAGVQRKPSAVVPLDEAPAAAAGIDEGRGTVWTADATEGFNGGGTMVRWVVGDPAATIGFFRSHCTTVRVMPFVDGVPCSVHGWVLVDGTAAFRPVEMVTLRHGHQLVYSGCSTYWDPPAVVREQMRDAARRVGELLREEVGYRGAFTVDGVVDEDGFWPTELNPRFGAGLSVVASALPDLPLTLLHDLTVAGVDIGATVESMEAEILGAADGQRSGGTWRVVAADVPVVLGRPLTRSDEGLRWAEDGEVTVAAVIAGNGFVRFGFDPAVTPVGPSVGALACEMWAFAANEWGVGPTPLTPSTTPSRPTPLL